VFRGTAILVEGSSNVEIPITEQRRRGKQDSDEKREQASELREQSEVDSGVRVERVYL